MTKGHVVMGLLFFPRGGSAQVARYLSAALMRSGWSVDLVAGSLGGPGDETDASTFFTGIPTRPLDYSGAVEVFAAGGSAVGAPVPMHPSYEDREGAPDVVFAAVAPGLVEHLSSVWEPLFEAAGAGRADVVHLHHLTPQHDAVRRRWPDRAVVAHLHGTETKFIEAVSERVGLARSLGTTLAGMPAWVAAHRRADRRLDPAPAALVRTTRWEQWIHGEYWCDRLRRQAQAADHLVVVSPTERHTAADTLGVDAERITDVPNGVDVSRFAPRPMSPVERRARFRHWLVEDPQGWDAGGAPGTVAYREADLDRLLGRPGPSGPRSESEGAAPVLIFVGRFSAAKRVPLLVRAFARARGHAGFRASLLVWGGHPGEWEGEHPVDAARDVGADGIFFAGWRGHDDLPEALAACDALVMPSVDDSYPQTPLEAMAVGLPVIATTSGGFPFIVNVDPVRPTGWLVPPDDEGALAEALVDAVARPYEMRRRGAAALAHAREHLSWSGRVAGFEEAYASARDRRARRQGRRRSSPPDVSCP
ncbi:MAG TPA: glycosyltransferase family 4 protein [Acidimicrobiales bacterium]|nr:glycosyltransferase family 4 protein [Acidimicrobiales bacterium]